MRKTLAAGLAALTFGGAVAAAAIPATADAREWHGGYHGDWDHHRGNNNAAIFAGVAGLALGAALADSGRHSYYRGGYAYGYAPGYYDYDGYSYRTCESRRWVWDPYIGRRVLVTSHYAC
ncbi:hypothetical protein [Phenylobacterium sp.]|uniref:hypothetical protein n=1 Tax=Phenylobacterium sp. TaxID=1871053 RepID=UPI002DEB404B|nr:hypothetical protein [Phenylobacterium sp.]